MTSNSVARGLTNVFYFPDDYFSLQEIKARKTIQQSDCVKMFVFPIIFAPADFLGKVAKSPNSKIAHSKIAQNVKSPKLQNRSFL